MSNVDVYLALSDGLSSIRQRNQIRIDGSGVA